MHEGFHADDDRLLEREADLRTVRAAVSAAAQSRGSWVVVAGQAGIGKTELVRAALSCVSDVTVAWATGSEFESDYPFGVVRQLLEPLVTATSDADALFTGAAHLARAVLAPPAPAAPAIDPEPDFATLHGLYWLCVNLSDRRPLVLVVDDVQWADEASLHWLGFLARRVPGLPVLILMTQRSGTETSASPGLDALLLQTPTTTIRPAPLSERATADLVARALGTPADPFVAACHRATRGNPLFLGELLSQLRDRQVAPDADAARHVATVGPVQVGEMIRRRLDGLPPETGAIVRAAAVLGDGADPAIVHRLAEVGAGDAAEAGHRLERAELLSLTPRVAFVHPVVRAAVVAALAPAERAALHARAATLLEEAGDQEGAAVQLLHVPPSGDAARVGRLREAARRAQARGAARSAAALYERALAEPPPDGLRTEILLELGRAQVRARPRAAVAHLSDALASTAAPDERAVVADELARVLHTVNRSDEALRIAEGALDALPAGATALRERLHARIGELASFSPQRQAILARIADDPDAAESEEVRRRVLARHALDAHLAVRPAAEVIALATAALDGGKLVEDHGAGSMPLFFALSVLARSGPIEQAEAHLAAAIASARRRAAISTYVGSLSVRARLHVLRGDVAAAEADVREIDGLDERSLARAFGEPALLLALVEQGRAAEAELELSMTGPAEAVPESWVYTSNLHARGIVRAALGRHEEGLADLLESGRRQEAVGARNPADLAWRGSTALVLHALDRADEARALAREEVELARLAQAPAALGAALRVAALVCDEPALRAEALAVLEGTWARLELAKALVDEGRALRESGARAEARPVLRRARELAARGGASAVEAAAADELVKAGARPRTTSATGASALTPGERRTAELVAEGMTNREVAQALFVTEKTVEAHLGRVFRKLGVSSRIQVQSALAGGAPEGDAG